MRYVTSLNKVDKQIIIIVAIALGIGLGILGMVYFSNLYFIRSIVDPVAGITETAKRIAAGSYGVQIEKRYDDEIGPHRHHQRHVAEDQPERKDEKRVYIVSVP